MAEICRLQGVFKRQQKAEKREVEARAGIEPACKDLQSSA
jgi:hypothetical protein